MTKIVTYPVYGAFAIVVHRGLTQYSVSAEFPDGYLSFLRAFSTLEQAKEYADDLVYEYRLMTRMVYV